MVSYVRADHIGRPVFATNASGVKVWSATYTPFGGVTTSTGVLPANRFPGQWFQSESGLHQNWMRDYDPTTGRYLQADPLGLVDGASIYGYAGQSPMMNMDPSGQCFGPAVIYCAAAAGAAIYVIWGWLESSECDPYTWQDAGWDAANGAVTGATAWWGTGAAWNGGRAAWAAWAAWRGAGPAAGAYTVYQGVVVGVGAGVVRYVGITMRNVATRGAEHAAEGGAKAALRYSPHATGLTKQAARKVEQQLINQYGLKKFGGQLLNKINSIAPKNWPQYGIK